ncbi:aminotransferase class I/II-fold pyridoxal phosphate-dependent enzyme [bacterium SCSIO 12741]|nr:aminotransferase class I/II-fold pyridoxal phosphate-dependent enzyme [bacterium SCSIO 12741]
MKAATRVIRTQLERTHQKEHSSPLFLTSSFVFDTAEEGAALFSGDLEGNLYSRFSNPNTDEFIARLCTLEGTETGIATASGMSAVYVALAGHLQQGDHVVASKALFGNSLNILQNILPKQGITHTLVDLDDVEGWQAAIQSNTRLLLVETPSNPTLKIADLAFLGKLCKAHDLIYVVDNCFATPVLQQPVKWGADLVLHSATKYIDGQGRVLGGAILGKEEWVQPCYEFLRRTGASLSPFNAWVLSKSLETLSLRMERHSSNALQLATFLESVEDIEQVNYPYLPSYPYFNLAQKQMDAGGGLVGCVLRGGKARGARFLNALKIHSLTANLGDVRSIATHPASTTHSKLSEEAQQAVGITPGFIRFSVGLEHIDDLIEDVEQALKHSR